MPYRSDATERAFQKRLFRLCRCPDARREYDHWHGEGAAAALISDAIGTEHVLTAPRWHELDAVSDAIASGAPFTHE